MAQPLTPEQIAIIKVTVPIIAEHGLTVTKLMYKNMLESNPSLQDTFNHTHQQTSHQASALANAVHAYAANIDNLGALTSAVERICNKHASLYIKPENYATVGTNLLAAFGEVLGDAFTKEVHDAWAAAYWQLANIFISREKQLYTEGKEWQDWRPFVLDKKVKESEEITSLYLKPKDGKALPLHVPGQYISVRTFVPQLNRLQPRQYSVSSAPNKDYIRISVKREDGINHNDPAKNNVAGWISNKLHDELNEGDEIEMSHPYGDFFFDAKKNPSGSLVLLSAGVGLTPLISMLESVVAEKSERKVSWITATRSSAVQAFGERVQEIVKNHSNVHSVVFNKAPAADAVYNFNDRLNVERLDKENDLFLSDKSAEYYVCGPEAFMKDMAEKLKGLGVEESRIKYELFTTQ